MTISEQRSMPIELVPVIDPAHVTTMVSDGFSLAQGVFDEDFVASSREIVEMWSQSAHWRSTDSLPDLPLAAISLGVHEAFFQAGFSQWEPNYMIPQFRAGEEEGHYDHPRYLIGAAVAYLSEQSEMELGPTKVMLGEQRINPAAGDILFVRCTTTGFVPEPQTNSGRYWHRAIGPKRHMLHMGYVSKTRRPA